MTPWQRFIGLLQLDKRDIKQVFFYAIFSGFVALSLPLGIQAIIALIQVAQITTSWILLVILVTLGVAFQGGLQLMQTRILENIKQKIFIRSSFEFAYRFPKIKNLENYYPPELANRFFDTLTVQKGLSKILIDFPTAVVQIVFGLVLLSLYHPFFIFYGILLVLLMYFLFGYTGKQGLHTSLHESKSKYKVAHWIQEVARSLISFKLSGGTDLAMKRNDVLTAEYIDNREKHFKVLLLQFSQIIGFKVLITAGLLVIGGILVIKQQMNIGQFVAAEIIILLVMSSVEKIVLGLETFYDVLTSLEKIGQIVDKPLENQDGMDPFKEDSEVMLDLENVAYYTANGEPILQGLTAKFTNKDRVVLKGPSGSGTSTVLKLLSGLIEPSAGSFYVNNSSIKGIKKSAYRKHVGQVLPEQKPFEGSIKTNITLGNPTITGSRLMEVIKDVGLLDFVKKQANGVDTILHPEGQKIPNTIARRIVFARAIVHQPKVLLLKDPFNQFEPKAASKLIEYVCKKGQPWLVVVASNNSEWSAKCNISIQMEDESVIAKN